jgi:hypothetical protein
VCVVVVVVFAAVVVVVVVFVVFVVIEIARGKILLLSSLFVLVNKSSFVLPVCFSLYSRPILPL